MQGVEMMTLHPLVQEIIWLNVADGVRNHGSFLRAFGQAYKAADAINRAVLEEVSMFLIEKHNLSGPEYYKQRALGDL